MAFSHLINCLLLAYGPYFVSYKAKNLAEQSAYKTVLLAILGCLITQFCKLFLLASLSVLSDAVVEAQSILNVLDCYGIYLLIKYKSDMADKPSRILAMAIGWSFMEATLKYFFPLVQNATTDEFTWQYILMGLTANFEFFENIFLFGLIYRWKQVACIALIVVKLLVLTNVDDLATRAGISTLYMAVSRFVI